MVICMKYLGGQVWGSVAHKSYERLKDLKRQCCTTSHPAWGAGAWKMAQIQKDYKYKQRNKNTHVDVWKWLDSESQSSVHLRRRYKLLIFCSNEIRLFIGWPLISISNNIIYKHLSFIKVLHIRISHIIYQSIFKTKLNLEWKGWLGLCLGLNRQLEEAPGCGNCGSVLSWNDILNV